MKQLLNITTSPPLVYQSKARQDAKIDEAIIDLKKQRKNKQKIVYKNDIWKRFKTGKEKNGITSVKGLYELQYNKCCYCEQGIALESARLDHYRPRESYVNTKDPTINHNGYYWLAYDWNNFLVLCEVCNSRKSSKFPIEDVSTRAKNARAKIKLPEGSLGQEVPALINPRFEDPYEYYFIDESQINVTKEIYLKGIGHTNKGNDTIEEIDLNRDIKSRGRTQKDFLMKKRHKVISELRDWIDLIGGLEEAMSLLNIAGNVSACEELVKKNAKMKGQIKKAISDGTEFSGLCEKYLIQRGMQFLL